MKKELFKRSKISKVKERGNKDSNERKANKNILTFWPYINNEFFKDCSEQSLIHLNQTIQFLSNQHSKSIHHLILIPLDKPLNKSTSLMKGGVNLPISSNPLINS